jgi:hypothetical protein
MPLTSSPSPWRWRRGWARCGRCCGRRRTGWRTRAPRRRRRGGAAARSPVASPAAPRRMRGQCHRGSAGAWRPARRLRRRRATPLPSCCPGCRCAGGRQPLGGAQGSLKGVRLWLRGRHGRSGPLRRPLRACAAPAGQPGAAAGGAGGGARAAAPRPLAGGAGALPGGAAGPAAAHVRPRAGGGREGLGAGRGWRGSHGAEGDVGLSRGPTAWHVQKGTAAQS